MKGKGVGMGHKEYWWDKIRKREPWENLERPDFVRHIYHSGQNKIRTIDLWALVTEVTLNTQFVIKIVFYIPLYFLTMAVTVYLFHFRKGRFDFKEHHSAGDVQYNISLREGGLRTSPQ